MKKNKNNIPQMEENEYKEWLNETVETIPGSKGLYKLATAIIGRKMTYKELIAFIERVNVRKIGKKELFEAATKDAIAIYEKNNGHLPAGVEKIEKKC